MPSIRIEAGSRLIGRERDVMLAVSEATYKPLSVTVAENDVVMTCHEPGKRLIGAGRSGDFCRVEIKMLTGRSDVQKAELRTAIVASLAAFGVTDGDIKMIVTDVPRANLGR